MMMLVKNLLACLKNCTFPFLSLWNSRIHSHLPLASDLCTCVCVCMLLCMCLCEPVLGSSGVLSTWSQARLIFYPEWNFSCNCVADVRQFLGDFLWMFRFVYWFKDRKGLSSWSGRDQMEVWMATFYNTSSITKWCIFIKKVRKNNWH